jgi:hypothetical protein
MWGRAEARPHILSGIAPEGAAEILNLQPRRDGTAKPYQVRKRVW